MDPTLNPFNFEPTGLSPEQLAAMVPQMSTPPAAPAPPPPPMMAGGAGGGPWLPWQPLPQGPAATPPAAPPVGGSMPEAIAGQLARWGVGPGQVLPGLAAPQGGPSVGALLAPGGGMGVGGEVARDAAAAAIPPTAAPASGMAPKAPGMGNPFQGLTMPTAPAAQKVSTPAAPRPTGTIKGGELLALLQALGAGGGQPGGLPIPSLASAVR